ncbi:MAG: sugar ABC transporter permease [Candidatus Dormibacteraeota bacterium]|nr:sugar ABC transporter permease [Candidatus Dormibacteraeota bacterium]
MNPNFLTPRNLTNLATQTAATGTISVGIVLVLLLGEIDLSVGQVSGLCAGIMAVLNVKHGVPAGLAIASAVVAGGAIGFVQGFWFSRLRIPSFVVTLAGLLAWQGALLLVLGSTGTLNLTDNTIDALAGTYLPDWAGWTVGLIVVLAFAGSGLLTRRRRRAADLDVGPIGAWLAGLVVLVILVAAALVVLNGYLGVPLALLILLGFALGFDFLVRRTRFGRYIMAVGGSPEAARRAGISVNGIRTAVFTLAGVMAACGGVLAASRLLAVNQSSGGSDLLLNVIAAAVIGGTSLFGGRGSVWSAVTGALVIISISNGMDLLGLPASIKFVITGAVLLAAVTIDGVARHGRQASGKA